jgi:PDDEXK-like uncharacterized protein DUF3799
MSFQNCKIAGVNVDPTAYHAEREKISRGRPEYVMSPSAMNAFRRVPSRWFRGWTPKETKAKDFGNLLDCRALTPDLFRERYVVEPATYPCEPTKRDPRTEKPWRYGANYTDAWYETQVAAGKEPISSVEVTEIDAAIERLFTPVDGDDTIQRWFDSCQVQVQVTGEWMDEGTGLVIPVSALLDFVPQRDSEFRACLGDLKTCTSAHPLKFQRQAFDYGYHIQAAFDLDIFNAATGEERNTWCFILQENFAPWEPNRCMYGQAGDMGQPSFVDLGREERFGGYEAILKLYAKCLKTGKWPGYNSMGYEAQGWAILSPEPFMAERSQFGPQFEFSKEEEEQEQEETIP